MDRVTIQADIDFQSALLAHGMANERGITLGDVLAHLVRRFVLDLSTGAARMSELPQGLLDEPKARNPRPIRGSTRAP